MTGIQAEQALAASGDNCFLIRKAERSLFTSLMHEGQFHHIKIKYGPRWYELASGSAKYSFVELDDLIAHYSREMINGLNITLGRVCAGNYNGPVANTAN